MLYDTGTLDIVDANAAAAAYYGRPGDALLSVTYTDLLAPEDAGPATARDVAAEPVERDRPPTPREGRRPTSSAS